ncbi:MAG: hypothetical protein NC310_02580 [Roseburia sp.]|nr:hypothetical protein [Anaeroplasma bactoclasticum]MCM1195943.1 hypothetical protein [Roseburia sp.]MCM1555915.1 hypothetical protein [Anaeroplasma bactoclasticum]
MKENKKKKFHFRLPKLTPLNLILMILIPIILFIIIAIPILYVNEYNANKVTLFSSDLAEVNKKEIVYGNKNTEMDFEFVLYCTNYDNASGTIKFQAFIYENENTRNVINLANKVKIRLGMYSDWIKVEQTSSSYEKYIATGPKAAKEQTRSRYDFTLNNIPTLPKKGNLPFIKISSIPVYAYITYTTTINGTEATKRYILKYNYSDYVIDSKSLFDNREKELNVSSSNIQWRYKKDTSWTNSTLLEDLTGIEARTSDTHIQWKRKCDTEWTDLKAFKELSGYIEGVTPEITISSSYIRYRFDSEKDYSNLTSISSLQELNIMVEDGYIQWKRKNSSTWTNLKALTELENYTEEKTVQVQQSGNNIQWKYSNTTTWITLTTVQSLIGVEVQFDENKNIQWKCIDETEWRNLIINGEQATEANIDNTPIKYGPTAGGIE